MTNLVHVEAGGRRLEIEYTFVGHRDARAPALVFLHEGLGSVSMWRDFPARLCEAADRCGLVYSRPGYGRSTPRRADEHWRPDFMHRHARELLPALLAALSVSPPYALFGHSDGGSIALLHAAAFPERVAQTVVLAPHILVEDVSVSSIAAAREAYLGGDLKQRLERHHADADSAFWGWNDIWLDPAFRDWSIEGLLPAIRCPVLAIQGQNDEYGSMAQIEGIKAALPAGQCRLLALPACGHSPHRDQPADVIAAVATFLSAPATQPQY